MEKPISIVQEILQDREKGTARLISEYRERLYSAAFALCRNAAEAEDLVFRTFEQVVRRIETCRNEQAFYDWMYAILLNAYRNSVRGKMVRNSIPVGGWDELEGLAGVVDSPPVAEKIDGDIIKEVIDTLPPRLREAVVLHYFMDQSVSKIAKFLSIADGTVMSRLHYARIALAKRLGVKLKKPAVALIAAGLLLLGATASVVFSVGGRKELVAPASSAAHAHGNDLKSIDMCDSFLASSTTTEENTMNRLLTVGAAVAAAAYTPVTRAEISYSYENDNKTLVVTVDSDTWWLQDDQYQAALNNNTVTNLVKRGAGAFGVNGTARNFTGDVRIEDGKIQLRGTNPLGTKGRIYVPGAPLGGHEGRAATKSVIITQATVGKDIVTESGGVWSDKRTLDIWGTTSTMNGKLFYGDHDTVLCAYAGTVITFNGGVGNLASASYPYFKPSGGATFVYSGTPYDSASSILISPVVDSDYPLDSQGFAAHFMFSVAGNRMTSFGLHNSRNNYWAHWCELKTTVDWAFDDNGMTVYLGHDSVWDLCGTEQRIGQMGVATIASSYKPPVVTNSLTTPATLHMRQIYGQGSTVPNIRIGGNLSVVYEGNVNTTTIDHEITAKGDLTLDATGTLAFTENGSWANARNVTVRNGKITIANPNALWHRANVNLDSNSSLEIASRVTVMVRTLTVGGVQKPNGDYAFGSGTLRVFSPGFVVSIH